ncbi:MAG: hydrogenase maturation nickel metallochaperone HypA [Clostridia bacterium]
MHETVLVSNLLMLAREELETYRVKRVNTVTIALGKLANALPDALCFAFEASAQHGFFKGAKLLIKELPITAKCRDCDKVYSPDGFPFSCPICGSVLFELTGGEEVYISSIDFEEDDVDI